jgi:mannitol/fructose-specific phosphotransferase system IIA component (Ntr-type)
VQFDAPDRWQAIRKIVEAIFWNSGLSCDEVRTIGTGVLNRESNMSTGIGFGIAFPHASSDLVPQLALGFFRAAAAIEWAALDQEPVQVICCAVVPRGKNQEFLPAMARIAKALRGDFLRLTAACSLEEFCSKTLDCLLRSRETPLM